MPKFEYCRVWLVVGLNNEAYRTQITHWIVKPDGFEEKVVLFQRSEPDNVAEIKKITDNSWNEFMKYIAKLGLEGWEVFQCEITYGGPYHFRRRSEDS